MTVVAQMLLSDPKPLIIWAIMLLSAMLAFAGLAKPDAAPFTFMGDYRARRDRRRRQAADLLRYADELTVVAQRAVQTSDRWQAHWQQAEQAAGEAWHAWQEAEQRLARIQAAGAFTMPAARTPEDCADRERFLHRTVRAAVDRGDLPRSALADAVAGRAGWDPRRHPVEQELAVHRVVAAYRRSLHSQAAAAEEAAWHDARLAISSRDRLRQEAVAATVRAAAVRHLVPLSGVPSQARLAVPRLA